MWMRIAEITSYAAYAAFGDWLRALGFQEDTSDGAPLCRWVQRRTILDVGSPDLEDLISVVDGRTELAMEVRAEAADLRAYVRAGIKGLLATPGYLDALPGFLLPDAASQSRIGIVLRRLEDLTSL
jgi:hypothetical protein